MRTPRLALLAALCSCDAGDSTADPGSGKADDAGQVSVQDPCQRAHDDWLLNEYAPLSCAEGPDCVGRTDLSSAPKCEGEPSYAAWDLAFQKHVATPSLQQIFAARNAFMVPGSDHAGDYGRYVSACEPTSELRSAHESLLAIQPAADLFDYQHNGLARYWTGMLATAFPLPHRAQLFAAGDGRTICGALPSSEDLQNCGAEPSLFLNGSEQQMLDLLESSLPKPQVDGAFAAWLEVYFDVLTSAENDLQFRFPRATDQGLAPYELQFFERLRNMAPTPQGERDSAAWVAKHLVLLASHDLESVDDAIHVGLWEASRPVNIVGPQAYAQWLGVDLIALGLVLLHDQPAAREQLLRFKPCARDSKELEAFETIRVRAEGLPPDAAKDAEPSVCP